MAFLSIRPLLVLSLLLPCAGVMAACSSSSEDPPATATPEAPAEGAAELKSTVGPEGGVLEGAPESEFAGVKLEIPAGALAAPTEIVIRATLDPTPLPSLAERVGAQFSVEGATSLSSPATLTLPVDAATVSRFEQADSDVKVWVRAGESWKLVEATKAARGTVSIAFDAFSTAAAGVKVTARPALCVRFPQLDACKPPQPDLPPPVAVRPHELPLSEPCNVPEAYCISRIGQANPLPEDLDGFEVTEDAIYYLFGESANKVNVARMELATGAISQPLTARSTTSTLRRNLAIDGATAWVGLGPNAGNVHLRPKFAAEVFDTDRNAIGAVQIPGGAFLRLDVTAPTGIPTLEAAARSAAGTFGARAPLTLANGDGTPTHVKVEPGSGALWAMQSVHMRRATVGADGSLTAAGALALPTESNSFYVDFALNTTGRIAVITSEGLGFHESAGSPSTPLPVGAVFGAAFLGSAPLIATSSSAPELFVELGGSTLPRLISLTDATVDDPAYAAAIPRGIRSIPGSLGAVFLTQGHEFFVLRISTSTIPLPAEEPASVGLAGRVEEEQAPPGDRLALLRQRNGGELTEAARPSICSAPPAVSAGGRAPRACRGPPKAARRPRCFHEEPSSRSRLPGRSRASRLVHRPVERAAGACGSSRCPPRHRAPRWPPRRRRPQRHPRRPQRHPRRLQRRQRPRRNRRPRSRPRVPRFPRLPRSPRTRPALRHQQSLTRRPTGRPPRRTSPQARSQRRPRRQQPRSPQRLRHRRPRRPSARRSRPCRSRQRTATRPGWAPPSRRQRRCRTPRARGSRPGARRRSRRRRRRPRRRCRPSCRGCRRCSSRRSAAGARSRPSARHSCRQCTRSRHHKTRPSLPGRCRRGTRCRCRTATRPGRPPR
jgi:hypothetical protein